MKEGNVEARSVIAEPGYILVVEYPPLDKDMEREDSGV